MSITVNSNRRSYGGDGQTTAFAFSVPFIANTDLVVILRSANGAETPQLLGTDYSVSGAGSPGGGTVTFGTAPAAGVTVVIYRDVPLTQPVNLQDGGPLPAGTANGAFDRLTMQMQRVYEMASRSLRLRETDEPGSGVFDVGGAQIIGVTPGTDGGRLATVGQIGDTTLSEFATFTPIGVGAVHRTIQSKLRDVVYVEDFGAVGDGRTDDTAAIQKAIDSLMPAAHSTPSTRAQAMAGGGTVRFRSAVYRTTDTIYAGAYIRLVGDGGGAFPQQAIDTPASPNGTVILADFPSGIRATAPIIQFTPWVMAAMDGQTVGTRWKSLGATFLKDNADVDGGKVSYCDGAYASDLSLFAVNRTFCGLRLSATSASQFERVYTRNTNYAVIGEANWESSIKGFKCTDFTDFGYYGDNAQHSLVLSDNWWHGGRSDGAVPTSTAMSLSFAEGCHLIGNSIEQVFNSFSLLSTIGISITGSQIEQNQNVVLTGFNARGVRFIGNSLYNPVSGFDDRNNFLDATVVDGNGVEILIDGFQVDHPDYTPAAVYGGLTFRTGTNPLTGDQYGLSFTGEKNITIRGFAPRAGDPAIVTHTGLMSHEYDGQVNIIARAPDNNVLVGVDLRGTSGVSRVDEFKVNETRVTYKVDTAVDSKVFRDSDSTLIWGYDIAINAALASKLLVDTPSLLGATTTTVGFSCQGNYTFAANSGFQPMDLQRLDSDGAILGFYRQTTNVGSVSVSASATAFNTSSDYRLKENVVPMTGAADRLAALKPCRYNFKVEPDVVVDGFLAHEAAEIVPNAVVGAKDAVDKDGNIVAQAIDHSKMVPLLTAALQEALARIKALEDHLVSRGVLDPGTVCNF